MAELNDINKSGELTGIYLNGTTPEKKVVIQEAVTIIENNVTAVSDRTAGISFTPAANPPVSGRPDLNRDHIAASAPVVMEGEQVIPTVPAERMNSHELMSLKTFMAIMAEPVSEYELIGHSPTMKMVVETGGTAAQMQVLDQENMHLVATMEWLRSTGEFMFSLFDKTTGISKANFEIKLDGNAYIGDEKVLANSKWEFTDHVIKNDGNDIIEAQATGTYLKDYAQHGFLHFHSGYVKLNYGASTNEMDIKIAPIGIIFGYLTKALIDAGGGKSAVTKEWVEDKVAAVTGLGNYSFDGDKMKHGSDDIIDVDPSGLTKVYSPDGNSYIMLANRGIQFIAGMATPLVVVSDKVKINDVLHMEKINSIPAMPEDGDIFYDGTDFKVYVGTAWKKLAWEP